MIGPCPYICNNKTEYGYCQMTGCINPKQEVGYVGHWIWEKPSDDCRCSNCGKIADQMYPYCPWCGKKMDK